MLKIETVWDRERVVISPWQRVLWTWEDEKEERNGRKPLKGTAKKNTETSALLAAG